MTVKIITPPLDEVLGKVVNSLIGTETRKRILDASAKALAIIASGYPPEGVWNRPPGTRGDNRWYQRGFGSRWKDKKGRLQGIQNSQNLQRSWNIESANEYTASVFTGVTYAPLLLDPQNRKGWAGEHGWKTTDELADIFLSKFEYIVSEEVDKVLTQK